MSLPAVTPADRVLGDQDEVVVHHGVALYAEALCEELFLRCLAGRTRHRRRRAAGVERLARALCDHLHIDSVLA